MFGQPTQERRPPGWQVDPGSYDLLVGRSTQAIDHRLTIEISPPS
jgi:hypothetical protein